MPLTLPEPSTIALAVLLLLHVPPAVTSLNAVNSPTHTAGVPEIADGRAFTVSAAVT